MKMTGRLLAAAMLASVLVATPMAGAGEITFEDQRSKTITLTEPVDSVVILPKPIPFMYIAVDGGPQDLKGINPATKTVMLDSIIGQIFPALADVNTSVVTTGFVPNVEELLKIAPDVVIQWSGDDAHLIEPMERVGIKVVALGWGSREIEKQQLEIIGRLSGNDDRVGEFLDWQTKALAALDRGLAPIPREKRTSMVFIDTLANNEIAIFPAAQFFFTAPGLRNLAYEAGVPGSIAKINAETLLAWDPDIIVMNHYDVKQKPSDIYDNPIYSSLKAVQNHRVFKMPRLDPGSQEAPIIWQWMAKVGYPEVFDFDLRSEIRRYYADTYSADLTEEQIDGVLNMDANVSSPSYITLFGS
jgi:iron complex transport system substrate-binding protein